MNKSKLWVFCGGVGWGGGGGRIDLFLDLSIFGPGLELLAVLAILPQPPSPRAGIRGVHHSTPIPKRNNYVLMSKGSLEVTDRPGWLLFYIMNVMFIHSLSATGLRS